MTDRPRQSWARRLLNALAGGARQLGGRDVAPWRGDDHSPDQLHGSRAGLAGGPAGRDDGPGGLDAGRWAGRRRELRRPGEGRSTLGDEAWLWFEYDLPAQPVPPSGQAVVLRASRPDGLRLVPARVVEDSRGGTLLVAISGRVVRLQRRDHVRARVSLPPVSAVRLAPNGAPIGVLGVQLLDVSGGGVQIVSTEPLDRDERLRLKLRLDDGPPIPSTVAIVDSRAGDPAGPARAHACFGDLSEVERKRIVQFVYRQELDARRKVQGGSGK